MLATEASVAPPLPRSGGSPTQSNPLKPQDGGAYSFASEPRAVQASRKKYREPMEEEAEKPIPVNIMYDRRIYRGSTYAASTIPLRNQPDPIALERRTEAQRRLRAKKRLEAARRVRTPSPLPGRKNTTIQTDLYLEELSSTVPEAYAQTQTDAFLDRAPSPLYVPQKSGVDVATQVYEGELFDFDYEVGPILEVLVGKTIEQALMEVHEEEELELLRRHQLDFEARRNAHQAETQRLEDAERRRTEEKERRLAEQIKILKEKQEVSEKIAARAFAQSYLQNLVPTVFQSLSDGGYFYDAVEREVDSLFLPWLTGEVQKGLDRIKVARAVVDDILRNTIHTMNAK